MKKAVIHPKNNPDLMCVLVFRVQDFNAVSNSYRLNQSATRHHLFGGTPDNQPHTLATAGVTKPLEPVRRNPTHGVFPRLYRLETSSSRLLIA